MNLINKWQSLETWEEKTNFRIDIETNKNITDEEFKSIENLYLNEQIKREELIDQGYCPDCAMYIHTTNYTDNISESSCGCHISSPF